MPGRAASPLGARQRGRQACGRELGLVKVHGKHLGCKLFCEGSKSPPLTAGCPPPSPQPAPGHMEAQRDLPSHNRPPPVSLAFPTHPQARPACTAPGPGGEVSIYREVR